MKPVIVIKWLSVTNVFLKRFFVPTEGNSKHKWHASDW